MENSVNMLKQPAPSVKDETPVKQQRKYNMPNVGVVGAPSLSKTPIYDMVQLKKKENPHTVYKIKPKQNKYLNFYSLTSIAIAVCGIASGVKMFKK